MTEQERPPISRSETSLEQQTQVLSRFRLPEGQRGRPAIVVQLWWVIQQLLFAPSPQILFGWRRFLLRAFGAKIGKGALIRPSVRVTYPWKLTIGDYAWVGDQVDLYTLDRIVIGANAVVSQGSYLCTGSHNYNVPTFDLIVAPITIAPQAWVAAQAFIMPGVTVGPGAVVGVRSLVTKDVAAGTVVVGQPARIVGLRGQNPIAGTTPTGIHPSKFQDRNNKANAP